MPGTDQGDLYLPSDLHAEGENISNSYLRVWNTCPLEWALHYLLPHPSDLTTHGMEPHYMGAALPIGSATHTGLYHYRLSGWTNGADTGIYDTQLAITAARDYLVDHSSRFKFPEEYDDACGLVTTLLTKYDEERDPDFDWTVAADAAGNPALERSYSTPLMGGRFQLVVKADAIGITPDGIHCPIEYKTTSRFGSSPLQKGLSLAGQTASEIAILHAQFPTAPLGGCIYELLVKDRGRTSKLPWVERPPMVTVTPASMAKWLSDCEKWANEITWSVAGWHDLQSRLGLDPYAAALQTFTQGGRSNGQCIRYNRECDYYSYCANFDLGQGALEGLVPRSREEENGSGNA